MKKGPLAGLILFVVVCIGCTAVVLAVPQMSIPQFVGSSPDAARRIATSMVDYALPVGYQEHGGRDIGLVKMAVITPGGQEPAFQARSVILLSTYPSALGLSEDQYRRELRLAFLRATDQVTTLELVAEVSMQVRGEELSFEVFESFGEYDTPVRIMQSATFPGKSGDMILVFAGPIALWDQNMIRQFIASIQ